MINQYEADGSRATRFDVTQRAVRRNILRGGHHPERRNASVLFPVPFRMIEDGQQFKKWQWIDVRVEKANKDHRPESHKLYVDTIQCGDVVDTKKAWSGRWSGWTSCRHLTVSMPWTPRGRRPTVTGASAPQATAGPGHRKGAQRGLDRRRTRETAAGTDARQPVFGGGGAQATEAVAEPPLTSITAMRATHLMRDRAQAQDRRSGGVHAVLELPPEPWRRLGAAVSCQARGRPAARN